MVEPVHAALFLGAGRGTRMAGAVEDKILAPLGGRTVLGHSLAAFAQAGVIGQALLVLRDTAQWQACAEAVQDCPWPVSWAPGGEERQDSVLAGLEALGEGAGLVFIHDAARPLVRPESLRELVAAAAEHGNASLARRVTDTIKEAPEGARSGGPAGFATLDRSRLWAMETPQVFRRADILRAYREVRARGLRVTDDTAALAVLGWPVFLVESRFPNPKLTVADDFAWAEWCLLRRQG